MTELEQIYKDGHIDENQVKKMRLFESEKLFSIHWELRTILYLGILLLSSGIGILVYLNIDTIGHQAILAAIGVTCCACFYYANKHRLPYQNEQVLHSSPFFDYIVLLGCLLFSLFIGYFQYQYSPFGEHYGILVFIPTLVAFYLAYRFDHKGVLSLAITGLAATFGLSITPRGLFEGNDFSDLSLIITALILGILIGVWAWYSETKNIKKHFSFTYNNFSMNILNVSLLAALFDKDLKILSLLLLLGTGLYFIKYAITKQSYLFLLLPILYSYIGITYCVFYLLSKMNNINEGTFLFGMLYIIGSAIGVIFLFLNIKKIIHIKK